MMRSVEIVLVIVILASAFIIASFFAVLPTPRQISSPNLRELSLTTLQMLDSRSELSDIVFKSSSDASWGYLETALTAALPPNMIYNFTVYDTATNPDGTVTYTPVKTLSNAQSGLGTSSETASLIVASSNATFSVSAKRIPKTLYILNCSDANGWWITGYTSQNLAADLRSMLSPYFNTTIMVQSTTQLGTLLNGSKITGSPYESVTNAIVLNTFGEAVPIPAGYYTTKGYRSSDRSYANYTYTLGLRVNAYNWTWVSIVGYPFYYVTNTKTFNATQAWGIYGTRMTGTDNGEGPSGLNAFLRGLDTQGYLYNSTSITGSTFLAQFTGNALYCSNYYGIYPSPYQTSTRALPNYILGTYHLNVLPNSYVFNVVNNRIAGATYNHKSSDNKIHGSLTAIGLTRIPDIRITVLALLMFYHPTLFRTEFTSSGTSRLVVLQLGLQGGG